MKRQVTSAFAVPRAIKETIYNEMLLLLAEARVCALRSKEPRSHDAAKCKWCREQIRAARDSILKNFGWPGRY